MRKLLIGTATALALVAGGALAQTGGGGEQNTTTPNRATGSTMAPATSGDSGNWSVGNPGGTTAATGSMGGYTARGTAENPGSVARSGGDIDAREDPTSSGQGQTYDTLKQGGSGTSSTVTPPTTSGSAGKSTVQSGAGASTSPQEAQRPTGTHCPPGTPDCRPGNLSGR